MIRRLWIEQRGAQTLEFVALLPLVLVTLLLMLQVALFGYTLVVAESATREAALVAARDQELIASWSAGASPINDTAEYVAQGINVSVTDVACNGGKVTVTLEATIPNLLFDSAVAFHRSVTMPTQRGGCG